MSSVLTLAVKELETREGLKLEIRSQANCGGTELGLDTRSQAA